MRRPPLLPAAALVLVASFTAMPAGAQEAPGDPSATPSTTIAPVAAEPPAPPASPTTTSPTSTFPTTTSTTPAAPAAAEGATSTAPKVRGVGDSVFRSAESKVTARLRPEYRPRFRSVLGALVRDMTPTALEMAGNVPAAMVFGLGNPDLAEVDDDPGVRLTIDAAYLIRRTRHLPCMVWINVKENGVSPFYNQQWAQAASEFNDFLQAATVDGPSLEDLYSPNLHILDWNATASRHPGWFLADGLHLNATGQAGYAGKVDRFLRQVCPPTPG